MSYYYSPYECGGYQPPTSAVRLNAATGGAGPLPIITTLLADPINVVAVSIDTSGMSHPVVLLNFTSIISLPLGVSVTLNFEITRSFNGGAPVNVGSTYTFSTLVTALEAEAFGFQFFDNNLDSGLYTYSVQLSTNSIIDITPGLTVNNATLSALAVDNNPA
ncbi:DUF4489 domain-containing protein [Anoxybacterium hadale]|uniref:DUF4489 domain-containing protein n=1 Tax=Anoxybacterium hadale TaxID=3408580 RepID=A0ACD1AF20_9FIRM|nr:DUF4489 domain-containing protein [Clostridiales bacterium]